jgi:hypothetical protein
MTLDFPPVWLVMTALGAALMGFTLYIQVSDAVKHLRKPISKEIEKNRIRG